MLIDTPSSCAHRWLRQSVRALGPALLVFLAVRPASAEGAGAQEEASVRFQRAVEAAEHGQLSEAAREFEAAYALSPNPVVLYNLGQTQSALGRPVEAVRSLRRYLETETAPLDPDRAREVNELIARNERLIGVVALHVTPAPRELEVDAVAIDPGATTITLAAGRHVIIAKQSGHVPGSVTVEVLPETEVAATLVLEPRAEETASTPPAALVVPVVPAPVHAVAPREERRSPAALAVSWGGMALGAVALGVGTGFAISAIHLDNESKADGHCNAQGCDSIGAPVNAAALRNGNIATGLFIGGGVLAAVGVTTYLLTSPRDATHKVAARLTLAGRPGGAVNVALRVGF